MNIERINIIKTRLEEAFHPSFLKVHDESDKHVGHPGHQGGGRHFAVEISADCFKCITRVEAHRQIYALFTDMMPDQIHALKIKII